MDEQVFEKISLAMGSGGVESARLLEALVLKRVPHDMKSFSGGVGLDFPDDAAAIPLRDGSYLVVTVDSYTVQPIFFPGGDLGTLAAAGTVNDVLMMGGKPVAALDSLVIEEGLDYGTVRQIFDSMVKVFEAENVRLIGGDTKVMPKGQVDQMVMTTVGIGFAEKIIVDKNIAVGDKIIVSGPLGEHGAAILAAQHKLESQEFRSDVKPLTSLMNEIFAKYIDYVHAARDPTRGGLAMALHDWASSSHTSIFIDEAEIPVREPVSALCDMMGIDPLFLASEGVVLLAVKPEIAEEIVAVMKNFGYSFARVIGQVRENTRGHSFVVMKTMIGGYRVLEPPTGEIVPRIC
ncbi:MAG: hydrogenase expression/formation protein HypE [Candidatus Caldarchaeum sp.]